MERTKAPANGSNCIAAAAVLSPRLLFLATLAFATLHMGCCASGGAARRPTWGSAEFARLYSEAAGASTLSERHLALLATAQEALPVAEKGFLMYILLDTRLAPEELDAVMEGIEHGITIEAYTERWDSSFGIEVDLVRSLPESAAEIEAGYAPSRELLRVSWYGEKNPMQPHGPLGRASDRPKQLLHHDQVVVTEPAEEQAPTRRSRVNSFLGLYIRSLAAASDSEREALASEIEGAGLPAEEERWLRWTLISVGMDSSVAHELAGGDARLKGTAALSTDAGYDVRQYSNGLRLVVNKEQPGSVREAGLHIVNKAPRKGER